MAAGPASLSGRRTSSPGSALLTAWLVCALGCGGRPAPLGQAREYASRGDTEAAIAEYRFALATRPRDWRARLELARLELVAGRPGAALRELERVRGQRALGADDRRLLATLLRLRARERLARGDGGAVADVETAAALVAGLPEPDEIPGLPAARGPAAGLVAPRAAPALMAGALPPVAVRDLTAEAHRIAALAGLRRGDRWGREQAAVHISRAAALHISRAAPPGRAGEAEIAAALADPERAPVADLGRAAAWLWDRGARRASLTAFERYAARGGDDPALLLAGQRARAWWGDPIEDAVVIAATTRLPAPDGALARCMLAGGPNDHGCGDGTLAIAGAGLEAIRALRAHAAIRLWRLGHRGGASGDGETRDALEGEAAAWAVIALRLWLAGEADGWLSELARRVDVDAVARRLGAGAGDAAAASPVAATLARAAGRFDRARALLDGAIAATRGDAAGAAPGLATARRVLVVGEACAQDRSAADIDGLLAQLPAPGEDATVAAAWEMAARHARAHGDHAREAALLARAGARAAAGYHARAGDLGRVVEHARASAPSAKRAQARDASPQRPRASDASPQHPRANDASMDAAHAAIAHRTALARWRRATRAPILRASAERIEARWSIADAPHEATPRAPAGREPPPPGPRPDAGADIIASPLGAGDTAALALAAGAGAGTHAALARIATSYRRDPALADRHARAFIDGAAHPGTRGPAVAELFARLGDPRRALDVWQRIAELEQTADAALAVGLLAAETGALPRAQLQFAQAAARSGDPGATQLAVARALLAGSGSGDRAIAALTTGRAALGLIAPADRAPALLTVAVALADAGRDDAPLRAPFSRAVSPRYQDLADAWFAAVLAAPDRTAALEGWLARGAGPRSALGADGLRATGMPGEHAPPAHEAPLAIAYADALVRAGDPVRARAVLERAAAWNPGDVPVRRALLALAPADRARSEAVVDAVGELLAIGLGRQADDPALCASALEAAADALAAAGASRLARAVRDEARALSVAAWLNAARDRAIP